MDKRIILAVAGSGKTYHISNDFSQTEKVILISYTNANVANIRKEVFKRNDINIENIKFMTFDSFVYNVLLRPFEPLTNFKIISSGVNVNIKPEYDSREPGFKKITDYKHYFCPHNKYYIGRLSKYFIKQNNQFKKTVMSTLNNYCDAIYFDEFQDYNSNDFKILKYVIEKFEGKVIAVGDVNQSLLTPKKHRENGHSKPFNEIFTTQDLVSKGKFSKKISIDEDSLKYSRRVSPQICEFIRDNMGIDIYPKKQKEGNISIIEDTEKINNLLMDDKIKKLVWNRSIANGLFDNFVNWSYSKGDTYKETCIILTKELSNLNTWKNIKNSKIKNALYVALTRSEGNVHLIKKVDFDKWKRKYIN